MVIKVIKTRDGDLVNFDRSRIERVIEKAAESVGEKDLSFVDLVTDKVIESLNLKLEKFDKSQFITIEMIQDQVERELMESGYFQVMKHFIIYRNKRAEAREKAKEKVEKKLSENTFKITKTTGKKESFDMSKIEKTYKIVSYGLARKCRFEEISDSLKKYIVEGMKTSDITKMLIKSAIDLISIENTSWQFIAGRLALIDLYKEASNNRKMDIKKIYEAKHYAELFDEYIKLGLYSKDFYDYYTKEDILEAGKYLKKDYDFEYNYTTILMYKKRYLLNPNKKIKELPQEMYMSIALFLAMPEPKETRLKTAKKIYDYCSSGKISLPTPTLLNARTNFHQLSSCFKFNIEDDLRAIYHSIENMAQVSKFGGGIGVYLGNIRSRGGYIRGVKGAAGGVNPWIKVINDTAVAVNQLGARAGAISVTLDIFHRDIYSFLDLQTETGDIRNKSFDVFPAVTFPDLFMERVTNDENWTLFDPKEITDKTGKRLQDHFGEEFEDFYRKCEKNDDLELKEVVPARDLFKKYLKTTVETGMPYAFFRDTVNRANPNKHAGNIYSTQLCVEICQNTSPSKFIEETIEDGQIVIKYEPGDSVVCNLASINVAKVNTKEQIEKVLPIAMRILDNVIDLNFYPIKEAEKTAKKYRSVGLGFLGLAEYLAVNKLAYDSKEAREVVDKLFEKYAYETLKASNELATSRGTYEVYQGSEWSKGILLGKDANWFRNNSQMSAEWLELIENIKKTGVRFAYHLAPAPNTSTALVVGTTASILPIYKKYFVETNAIAPSVNVAPNLDEDNFWYYKEYVNMNMNDVIDMVAVIYKWIDQSISFEWMINPANVSPKELYEYYFKAHIEGIKTVYYVRSMSLEVKECSSCSG
ncbi:MAG: ribonucleoside-diphosphate reductase subunit alpha [Candidatus Gracilibacteria bacterium]|nr:ribonucleoside-diphosphate reductase subunit alpha [Candidatus Gracilibacteria bacterium]